jgi:hypothetical protein
VGVVEATTASDTVHHVNSSQHTAVVVVVRWVHDKGRRMFPFREFVALGNDRKWKRVSSRIGMTGTSLCVCVCMCVFMTLTCMIHGVPRRQWRSKGPPHFPYRQSNWNSTASQPCRSIGSGSRHDYHVTRGVGWVGAGWNVSNRTVGVARNRQEYGTQNICLAYSMQEYTIY